MEKFYKREMNLLFRETLGEVLETETRCAEALPQFFDFRQEQ